MLAGIGGWLGFLLFSRLVLLVDRVGFLVGDWLGLVPMSEPAVGTELALLARRRVGLGQGGRDRPRARGRWRLVAHAAQPTAWGRAELRRTLVDQLAATG